MKPKQLSLFDDDTSDHPKLKKEIQYAIARNENGKFVYINEAEKGKSYYCPKCNNDFILRKSGKTGKGSRKAHFAHKNLSPNCTPEGVLHHSFKKLLIDLLESYRAERRPLEINWKCDACLTNYSKTNLNTNLLEKTAKIEEEYNLKVCIPDIALFDMEDKIIAAIEIVVTHEPEENVLSYYKENGITLIQINLFSEDDLHKIQEKIINPDIVNLCLNTSCPNYKNHLAKKKMYFVNMPCKQYGHLMKTCYIEENSVFGAIKTVELTENDIKFAESNGVRFKIGEDKTTKKNFLGFRCPDCEKIAEQRKLQFQRMRSRRYTRRF